MEIKKGDKWSRLSYGEIIDVNGSDVQVRNEDGKTWWISKELVEQEFNTASSESGGIIGNMSQTSLIDKVMSKPGTVMTVNFNKKVDKKVAAELIRIHVSSTHGTAGLLNLAELILTGEERTIVGRHYHHIDEMGRLQFIDMTLPKEVIIAKDGSTYDTRLRKIDPRTINWVIIENIKYKK